VIESERARERERARARARERERELDEELLNELSNMILADEEHDNSVASNILLLQQEGHSHLDKLLKLLLELQVRVLQY
jgi:hypothetical protein